MSLERRSWGSPWWLLLLFVLPPITFLMHFHGTMVLGWDSEPPLRPEQYLAMSLSAWKWSAYLGQPNVFQITQAPLALIYVALSAPFGVAIADKLVLTVLFVLPAFTMYYAARRLFPGDGFIAFAAAWCYALCPLLFVRYYVPIVTVQLVYALLPLAVNAWVDLMRRGARPINLLWLAGVELAFLPSANNLAYWLVPQITAVAIATFLAFTDRDHEGSGRRRAFWSGVIVMALINGFWLLPQVMFGLAAGSTFEHEAINHAYTEGVRKDVASGSGLSYTLRMSSSAQTGAGDVNGPFWTYARSLENGLIAAPFFLWIALAAVAIALRARDRRVVILGVMLCIALFVMKGESAPFGFLLQAFYLLPLIGTIFRNGYDKLLPMAAFSFAILLPVAAVAVGRVIDRERIAQWSLLAFVLALAFPYWTGQMFMARPQGPNLATMPSNDAFTFTRMLDSLDSRVIFAPISGNPQLLATQWHFYGPNVYGSMTDAAVISMSSSIMNTPGSDEVMTALHDAIDNRDDESFRLLTGDAGIGYAFVSHDMDETYYGGETAREVDDFLAHLPGASVVRTVGPYTLWRLSWVPGVNRGLVRRDIIGYDTDFSQANALRSQCGSVAAPSVLIPLADGSCNFHVSPAAQPTANPLPVAPATVSLAGSALRVVRPLPDGTTMRAAVALPAATAAVQIGANVAGAAPRSLSLLACDRYAVRAYRTTTALQTAPLAFALPSSDGAHIPLPELGTGLYLVRVGTLRTGVGASATIADGVTGMPVTPPEHLAYPSSSFLLYALPGRNYQLNLGANEAMQTPRAFVQSLALAPAAFAGEASFVAPPDAATPCAPTAPARAYVVRPALQPAGIAVAAGNLIVHPYDPLDPAAAIETRLPRGSTLAAIGDDVAGEIAHDELVPTGAPVFARTYRLVGAPRVLPIEHAAASGGATIRNVDRAAGSATLRSSGQDQWLHFDAPLQCATGCLLQITLSAMSGTYGVALADDATGTVVASARQLQTPQVAFIIRSQPGAHYLLYIYSSPLDASESGVQVASVTTTPVRQTGAVRFDIPRVLAAIPTDPGAVLIDGAVPKVAPSFDGSTMSPLDRSTALVLDTQYDPFWTTLIFTPGKTIPYFPQHVVADDYKNAWIVPVGTGGSVVHFYLTNLVALCGLAVAVLTLLVLALRAVLVRRPRQMAAIVR